MGTIKLDDSAAFLLCHGKGSKGILAKSLEKENIYIYIAKDGCIYRELYGSIYAGHANYLCREEEVPLERGENKDLPAALPGSRRRKHKRPGRHWGSLGLIPRGPPPRSREAR